ncbi:MAG: chemotaxis protein CheW [Myxococcales bacterium]
MSSDLEGFFYDPDEEGLDLPAPEDGLRALPAPPEADRLEELLSFRLGGEDYAVAIASVHEILRPPPITEVPRAPPAVLGVISLRGEALPVFDPLKLLGLQRRGGESPSAARRVVVIDTAEGLAGLLVDAVEQVVRLPRSAIEPPPSGFAGAGPAALEGVGRWSGRLLAILDPVQLLLPEGRR